MKHHYLDLIWYKALAELRAEAARAYLGFLWWIVEPLLYMSAFYIVFGLVYQRGDEDFVPFLLCGLVIWKWFGSTVMSSSNAIAANAGLMQLVYLPKYLFPATVIVVNSLKFALIFGLLFLFLLFYGYKPSGPWLSLPLLIGIQFLLIAAVSGLVSAVVPFVPDLRLILENVLILVFFLSGIFFDIDSAPANLQLYLKINPMAGLIDSYRSVLLEGAWPNASVLAIILASSIVGIWIASRVLRHYDRIYPKVLV